MTKEEIKALIDAKIAGQGSAVDAGGALPAILSEILNLATQSPEIPHAIELSKRPETNMTTEEELAEIGLTRSEIEAAIRGERTGVVTRQRTGVIGDFFPIFRVTKEGESYTIQFGTISPSSSSIDSWSMWIVEISDGGAVVNQYEA